MVRRPALLLSVSFVACTSGSVRDPGGLLAPRFEANMEGPEAANAALLDLNAERTSLLAADQAYSDFSATTNILDGTMNMVAPDIVYIAPGPYITNADQLRAFLLSNSGNLVARVRWTAVRGDVSSDGQRGYTYGYTEITQADGSVSPGKYIAYWKRQADGGWKVAAYRRNARPAGNVSLTPPAGFETPTYVHYRFFPKTTAATERGAVFSVDQSFSDQAQTGVSAAFVAFAAPDGAVLSRLTSIGFGAVAIAENQAGAAPGSLIWSPSLGDAAETGDIAFTTGIAQTRRQNPDGTWTVTGQGKYLSVWKKQPTGLWRFVIDG